MVGYNLNYIRGTMGSTIFMMDDMFPVFSKIFHNVEVYMNFNEMVKKLDKNTKAFRPTWKEGELLWRDQNVLVHNTPYWGGDTLNQFINGYVYVSEITDIQANDWMVVSAQTDGANEAATFESP